MFHGSLQTAGQVKQSDEAITGVSDSDFPRVEANGYPIPSCAATAEVAGLGRLERR
jgi:hypothetical protein